MRFVALLASARPSLRWGAALGSLLLAAFLAAGCRTYPLRYNPLTIAEVLQMSVEKRPPDEIIQRIRESHTVYVLHARDVKDLLEKGVDERVVDEMLQTRLREIEQNARYYYGYPYPYYYGPYFGFGYGVGW
jgi:hypothetical protein